MKNRLRSIGKITAVFSALVLAGGYVASRAMPGLVRSVQVYGGEGGGRTVPANPAGELDKTILPSSKSFHVQIIEVIEPSRRPTFENQASTAPAAAPPSRTPPHRPQEIISGSKSAMVFGHLIEDSEDPPR